MALSCAMRHESGSMRQAQGISRAGLPWLFVSIEIFGAQRRVDGPNQLTLGLSVPRTSVIGVFIGASFGRPLGHCCCAAERYEGDTSEAAIYQEPP